MLEQAPEHYDLIIIGAGASGTALFYTMAKYSSVKKVLLIEKESKPGQINSKASNNSQTLHVGDIETNYTLEKVRQVYPAAMMVAQYAKSLAAEEQAKILFPTPKMVIGVGVKEVAVLRQRFVDLHPLFPTLQLLEREAIARVEPKVSEGRSAEEPVVALYQPEGYAVDFENLAQSFIDHALIENGQAAVKFSSKVERIEKLEHDYLIHLSTGNKIAARVIVVDADSYSLLMAKRLGYGEHFSLIPIAGTFYFSRQLLNGKVYTVQEPKLPFAAVHGDPDVRVPGQTRWGPTARFHPVLESYRLSTMFDYLRSSGLQRFQTWRSFATILLDWTRLSYLLKNMLYELPWVGTHMFVKNAKKIVPTIRARDIRVAEKFGGMRLQRVDTETRELQLGEGKIVGDHIIFNMTPSPGASVALYNAMRDAERVVEFLGGGAQFDQARMKSDLVISQDMAKVGETSLPSGYAS